MKNTPLHLPMGQPSNIRLRGDRSRTVELVFLSTEEAEAFIDRITNERADAVEADLRRNTVGMPAVDEYIASRTRK